MSHKAIPKLDNDLYTVGLMMLHTYKVVVKIKWQSICKRLSRVPGI